MRLSGLMLLFAIVACSIFGSNEARAQEKQIKGLIVSQKDSLPIANASVIITGTKIGTKTDDQGSFTLTVPGKFNSLTITAIGYQEQLIDLKSDVSLLPLYLVNSDNSLDEIVITAGGIATKRRTEGYASTIINSQQLTQAKAPNIGSALNGKVAGLQINAITGGVNPNIRLVLRGNRSLLGDNTALLVLDNVIVPSSLLSNLNPEDIQDINVLNGAAAAALYGADASNGAVIITTKKGQKGVNTVKVQQTTTFEQTSFYPKLQTEFGSGWETGAYTPYENQQYGPRFDGSMVQLGRPLLDGTVQMVPYSATNDRKDFWQTGLANQTDFNLTSGDEKGSLFFSGQYYTAKGTTPKDKYNRVQVNLNGVRNILPTLKLGYKVNYIQNRYDQTSQTGTIYQNLLNTPAQAPLLKYKDWQNDPFASPEGYYNDYYANPYFYIDNYRTKTRNDYLTGALDLNYKPLSWLGFVYRVGLTTQNNSSISTVGRYTFSDNAYLTGSKSNVPGSVSDGSGYSTQITSDFQAMVNKKVNDFSFDFLVGQSIRTNVSKNVSVSANGMVNPDLFNVTNRYTANVSGSDNNVTTRRAGLYGKLTAGYKNWLYANLTGRNDWFSVLDKDHRSFFYPALDVSFIPTSAIEALKNSNIVNNLKIRGGLSKVGNVNIGAYSLLSTFSQANGYPFSTGPGFSVDGRIVAPGLKPEMTKGWEVGFDGEFIDHRVVATLNYYYTSTTDQTVPTGVSNATGYSSFLTNTGKVTNKGLEAVVHVTPIRTADWTVTVGGNYTHNTNMVESISSDLDRIQLTSGGSAQVYVVAGQSFPMLMGTDYVRDPQGRVIVDPITGYPTKDATVKLLGNTTPKQRLSLDLEVKYKSFRLWALAEYRGGYYIYNNGGETMDFSGSSERTVQYGRERFVFPNSSYEDPANPGTYIANTTVQVRDGGSGFWANGEGEYNMGVATNYVTKGDFWKVREIALSYTLPQKFIGTKSFIKEITVGIQGRNLFLWTPKSNIYTDPEYSFSDSNAIGVNSLSQSPPSRYFGGTVSLTF